MALQTRLDNFFGISRIKTRDNTNFIYIPAEQRATFTDTVEQGDKLITCRSGLSLYIRFSKKVDLISIRLAELPDLFIPLIKSNLQKAIRRGYWNESLASFLYLLAKDPRSLFRRMPIIMVEDVCLFDSIPILIWFMIADKDYRLNESDIHILLSILETMITCQEVFYGKNTIETTKYNREDIQHSDCLLSLYYRIQYGGMRGDLDLLGKAIDYYKKNPQKIVKTVYKTYCGYEWEEPPIVWEAIDYHPYPQLLGLISQETGYNRVLIKELIWKAESSYNYRKDWTKRAHKQAIKSPDWPDIQTILDKYRDLIVTHPQYILEDKSTDRANVPSNLSDEDA